MRKHRTVTTVDGCATFYKRDRFGLVLQSVVSIIFLMLPTPYVFGRAHTNLWTVESSLTSTRKLGNCSIWMMLLLIT